MRYRRGAWVAVVLVVCVGKVLGAEPPVEAPAAPVSLADRETLSGDWWGLGERLSETGVRIGLGATQAYQFNVNGGTATHRHAGRYAGSYDLELDVDLERLAGLKGGAVYALAEGSWSDGLDASSVGSLFGVNGDAGGDRSIDVTELWYEQALADGRVRVRLGKIDLTGGFECRGCSVAFDTNAYANDETLQFINGALVNNPSIPFPDNGIGVAAMVEVLPGWYVAGGVADAQADARETGFSTAFHGEDRTVSLYETGLALEIPSEAGPMPGGYRAGIWYDPQPKDRFDGTGTRRDDVGLYLSLDQMLFREAGEAETAQGLGGFARFGFADEHVNAIRNFWSLGLQYQGLIPGRDADVVGLGMAQANLSREAGFTSRRETVMEGYYQIQVTPWLAIAPHVQYVATPGGDETAKDATVVGVRVQAAF